MIDKHLGQDGNLAEEGVPLGCALPQRGGRGRGCPAARPAHLGLGERGGQAGRVPGGGRTAPHPASVPAHISCISPTGGQYSGKSLKINKSTWVLRCSSPDQLSVCGVQDLPISLILFTNTKKEDIGRPVPRRTGERGPALCLHLVQPVVVR